MKKILLLGILSIFLFNCAGKSDTYEVLHEQHRLGEIDEILYVSVTRSVVLIGDKIVVQQHRDLFQGTVTSEKIVHTIKQDSCK